MSVVHKATGYNISYYKRTLTAVVPIHSAGRFVHQAFVCVSTNALHPNGNVAGYIHVSVKGNEFENEQ